LHILSYERATDPEKFLDYFRKHKIDAMKLVPSHFEALKQYKTLKILYPVKDLFLQAKLVHGTYRRSSQIKSELYDTESLWANLFSKPNFDKRNFRVFLVSLIAPLGTGTSLPTSITFQHLLGMAPGDDKGPKALSRIRFQ